MARRRDQAGNLPALLTELRDLVVSYAKQETVDPLRQLGRFVLYGVAGSLALGIGTVLLLLGALRLLQSETGRAFDGNWSWVPYLLVVVMASVVVALTLAARARGQKSPAERQAAGP